MWLPTARAPGGEGRQAGSRAVRPPLPVHPLLRPGNQFILFCLCSLNTQQRLDRAGGQGSCRHCQESLKVGRKPSQRGGACLPEASGTAPDRQAGRAPEKRTRPCRPHTKAKMRLPGSHSGLYSGHRSALGPGLTRGGTSCQVRRLCVHSFSERPDPAGTLDTVHSLSMPPLPGDSREPQSSVTLLFTV